jgi:hypothetical protein
MAFHYIAQKLNSTHGNLSLDFVNFAKGVKVPFSVHLAR